MVLKERNGMFGEIFRVTRFDRMELCVKDLSLPQLDLSLKEQR